MFDGPMFEFFASALYLLAALLIVGLGLSDCGGGHSVCCGCLSNQARHQKKLSLSLGA